MELVNSGPPPGVISTTTMERCFKVAKEDVVVRPIANFHPSLWGDYFIKNPSLLSTHQKSEEWMKKRVQELVKDVKNLLKEARGSMREEMQLIDALQRLGVAYHFEQEISEALSFINNTSTFHHSYGDDDLHLVALRFRLLRQHLYDASSDVFNQFKDDEGNFKEELKNDLKGLLSLYEAGYLGMPEEHVLDEAIEFTRSHLQSMSKNIEPRLAKQVAHALETPFRRRMSRLEARLYIPIYEEDIEAKNDVVLELAKLDFHLLQLLHREEVNKISIWWYDLGLTRELKFMRDRIVESYFWMLGVYFEPQYSKGRMMLVKVITILAMMDDIYDSYGTLHELQQFTLAIQRWELKQDDDQLDENLQLGFMAMYNTLKELEDEVLQDGTLYRINYLKREFKNAALVWLEEAKWREEGYVPSSLTEHLNLSLKTSGYHVLACASLLGIGKEVTKETLEWVTSFPQICKDITTISRLMDDAADSEIEDVATTIFCCMKEYGVSWEEAKLRILGMVENAWKDMNRECVHLNNIVPPYVLSIFVNLARMMEAIYRISDGFSEPQHIEKPISLLLVEPIQF
ncbi:(-)-germacrene D synthase protein [Dioscorea alata]|uniref:(-)-germacrene D synthase protein n=1 Tax=Dioscorea alata TaxID=55571 RepID=A0ACB7TXS6_DIOAL|nr:(-)-germacrene D synthase protein [Dioscorea alata]